MPNLDGPGRMSRAAATGIAAQTNKPKEEVSRYGIVPSAGVRNSR